MARRRVFYVVTAEGRNLVEQRVRAIEQGVPQGRGRTYNLTVALLSTFIKPMRVEDAIAELRWIARCRHSELSDDDLMGVFENLASIHDDVPAFVSSGLLESFD